VKTSGQKFTLNGSTFTVVGSNSYWVGLAGLSSTEIDQSFADIAATGATTVRTWGFNEVTSIPSAPYAYYQSWSGSTPTVNTGSQGLASFGIPLRIILFLQIKLTL
jgi:mannan endo-1,4-beta-mannosidase